MAAVSVAPKPSTMVMSALRALLHLPRSLADPEIMNRIRPPSLALSLLKTSLSATAYAAAHPRQR